MLEPSWRSRPCWLPLQALPLRSAYRQRVMRDLLSGRPPRVLPVKSLTTPLGLAQFVQSTVSLRRLLKSQKTPKYPRPVSKRDRTSVVTDIVPVSVVVCYRYNRCGHGLARRSYATGVTATIHPAGAQRCSVCECPISERETLRSLAGHASLEHSCVRA